MNKDIEQLISSYIEGDISEQDRIIIEKNIKSNKEFALKVDSIKNIVTSLNNIPSISTSEEFLSNLDNKINNSTVNERGYFFNKNIKLLFGFSSILIVAVLFISNYTNNTYNKNLEGKITDPIPRKEDKNFSDKDSTLKTHDNLQINQVDYDK